jgi:exodeoxyribonuclease V alpha subunit
MDNEFAYIDRAFAHSLVKGDEEMEHFLASLMKCTREGHLFLNATGALAERLTHLCNGEKSPLVRFEDAYYLRRIWELETNCTVQIKRLLQGKSKLALRPEEIPEDFYPAQKKAFEMIFTSPLSVISGGPGSGKTFFASRLIESILKQKPDSAIIGAAPTGKAASRLRFKNVHTGTLHSLLKLQLSRENTISPLIGDLILIDECSMIDLELWTLLLSSIEAGTHVVLIGDPNQLPPVETMGIFASLCTHPKIPHVHFDQSIRTDKPGLLQLGRLIKEGNASALLTLLKSGAYPEITLKPLPRKVPIENRTLLTPFVKGLHGAALCNAVIDDSRKESVKPIVIEKNAPTPGLVNGDLGTLEGNVATFTLLGENKTFPKSLLPAYSLAYAMTVHKSQGSEFAHVSLLLPKESEKFGKELLYTAVTRAKETLVIYADDATLENIVGRTSKSPSHFNKRLN